jgi:hypothetical protein
LQPEPQFTTVDWSRASANWQAWWAGELPRPLVWIEVYPDLPGIEIPGTDPFLTEYPLDLPAGEILDALAPLLAQVRYLGDAVPKVWPNFGAGVVAAFLGSPVEYRTGTTWFGTVDTATLADLHPVYNPANVWWRRAQEFSRTAAQRWGNFIIGHTDLGGNLDILASLRGTQALLTDLHDSPEEVERLVTEITALWLRYYTELSILLGKEKRGYSCWAPIWAPEPCYMLQSDFAYMISPKMFERFVLPDLEACCAHLDYGFYHLDGKGQIRHLDMLLSLKRLRGIQWIPGDGAPPPEEWLPLLKRIRDGGKLCQLFVTRAGAQKISHELGGEGFLFCIDEALTLQEAEEFLATFTI